MRTVWLVRSATEDGPFEIRECEGQPSSSDPGEWVVNVRGKGCRGKQFEVVPDSKVYKTRGAAEARVRELSKGKP